jgi:hypothetical protein
MNNGPLTLCRGAPAHATRQHEELVIRRMEAEEMALEASDLDGGEAV